MKKIPTLTDAERLFATHYHHLIYEYLNIRKLSIDEYYDVVVFRYLRSVHRYFNEESLQRYTFKTVAFSAMRSAIGHEIDKQKRRIQTISLDEEIPGTDGITLLDTVTNDNLNYLYIGDDAMKMTYNVELPERKYFSNAKSDEVIAIEGFVVSEMKNMCFEYDTEEEAKKKLENVQVYKRTHELSNLLDCFRNGKCVYVVRRNSE